MAFIGNYVDPNAQPGVDFAPIPAGEYPAIIVDSDLKPTAKNDGQYLELAYKITEGEYVNRQVWARLNLENANATTVRIANEHLASISQACGRSEMPTDSTQLHNIPHVIRVDFIPAGTTRRNGTRTDKDSNEVKGWKAIAGVQPQAGAQASPFVPAGQAAQPAANQAPGWARPAA